MLLEHMAKIFVQSYGNIYLCVSTPDEEEIECIRQYLEDLGLTLQTREYEKSPDTIEYRVTLPAEEKDHAIEIIKAFDEWLSQRISNWYITYRIGDLTSSVGHGRKIRKSTEAEVAQSVQSCTQLKGE